jgi:hypothetical protein
MFDSVFLVVIAAIILASIKAPVEFYGVLAAVLSIRIIIELYKRK